MKYIWQDYSSENNFYVETKPFSPYLEIGYVWEKNLGVNPIPRFQDIFSPLFKDVPTKNFKPLENCLLHYLAELDLNSGLHRVSIFEHLLDEEIRKNFFGERATQLYLSLTDNERRIFLIYLRRHEVAHGLKSFFFVAVQAFFPETQFYFHEWDKKILLCVPVEETAHNQNLMELLTFFLADMGVEYEIFWNCHFGIIGDDETIRLDDFVIY